MTTFFMLLATGAIAFAAGWAIACIALAQSHMRQATDFDRERRELDDEREALALAWLASAPPPKTTVSFAIGAHKKTPGVSA
jgi:heme/copper-type cytochrome/quinol oxidase subunit 1